MDAFEVNTQHDKAMEYAGLADLAHQQGKSAEADELYVKAYELEQELATELSDSNIEPSRSIIFRSAASLAITCKQYREAEKLISTALAGEPSADIAQELRDLLWEILPVLRDKVS